MFSTETGPPSLQECEQRFSRGLSLAGEGLLLRPSLLGHCPSAPELFLLYSKSFITPETSL